MATTSAKAWREAREKGIEITFPSGFVAAIRPIQVDFFLRVGHIPDSLAEIVNRLVKGETVRMENPPTEELEKSKEFCHFLDELAHYAFVSPKVVNPAEQREAAEDEITVDDIGFTDKVTLYRFFCQPAGFLRSFRDSQAQHVASVELAGSNGRPGKRAAEDQPVGISDSGDAGRVDSPAV